MKKILLLVFLLILYAAFSCYRIYNYRSAEMMGPDLTEYLKDSKNRLDEWFVWEERKQKFQDELDSLEGHPWAGVYHENGIIASQHLYLAPESGFFYTRYADGNCDHDYGSVAWKDGRLRLSSAMENNPEGTSLRPEFIPVPWGEECYLVPLEKMMDFCEQFNSGERPLFFRRGEWDTKVFGLPEVPEEYKKYLLEGPLYR